MLTLAAISSSVGWIGWIIIGGIAGALAGRIVRGGGFGILGDIIVGIIGGFVGGILLGLFVNADVGLWGSFLTALIGAVVLLLILRAFTGGTRRRAY